MVYILSIGILSFLEIFLPIFGGMLCWIGRGLLMHTISGRTTEEYNGNKRIHSGSTSKNKNTFGRVWGVVLIFIGSICFAAGPGLYIFTQKDSNIPQNTSISKNTSEETTKNDKEYKRISKKFEHGYGLVQNIQTKDYFIASEDLTDFRLINNFNPPKLYVKKEFNKRGIMEVYSNNNEVIYIDLYGKKIDKSVLPALK